MHHDTRDRDKIGRIGVVEGLVVPIPSDEAGSGQPSVIALTARPIAAPAMAVATCDAATTLKLCESRVIMEERTAHKEHATKWADAGLHVGHEVVERLHRPDAPAAGGRT